MDIFLAVKKLKCLLGESVTKKQYRRIDGEEEGRGGGGMSQLVSSPGK